MKKLGNVIVHIILLLTVLLLMFVLIVPLVFSGKVAVVLSSSMEPAMPKGSLAITMPVAAEEIKVGDIISFDPAWDPDVTVSHRVVEIIPGDEIYFRTKGDANEDDDPWSMPAEYVTGRVVFDIPYLGYVANEALRYVRTWWGLIIFVVIPSMLVIGITIWDVRRSRDVRVRRLKMRQKLQRQRG